MAHLKAIYGGESGPWTRLDSHRCATDACPTLAPGMVDSTSTDEDTSATPSAIWTNGDDSPYTREDALEELRALRETQEPREQSMKLVHDAAVTELTVSSFGSQDCRSMFMYTLPSPTDRDRAGEAGRRCHKSNQTATQTCSRHRHTSHI